MCDLFPCDIYNIPIFQSLHHLLLKLPELFVVIADLKYQAMGLKLVLIQYEYY